jgi:PIN domain nuclease of toxin-antitoxin system
MENEQPLSTKAKYYINNPENRILVSIVSFYEMVIKINIEKLTLNKPLSGFYADTIANQIEILPITDFHLTGYTQLPVFPSHKDPFDRLIISTAKAEGATLLSADTYFGLYKAWVSVEL